MTVNTLTGACDRDRERIVGFGPRSHPEQKVFPKGATEASSICSYPADMSCEGSSQTTPVEDISRSPIILYPRGKPKDTDIANAVELCGPFAIAGLVESIERDLQLPLSSMRAVVDSHLRKSEDAEEQAWIGKLLEQMSALCRTSELLSLVLNPPPIRPLSCSLAEIADSLAKFLPSDIRSRLQTSFTAGGRAWIDGPRLSNALAMMLIGAMQPSSKVGLELFLSADTLHVTMTITDIELDKNSLMTSCAWRELMRMNSSTSVSRSRNQLELSIEIPSPGCFQQEAAA
ncbi:MAG: hypothetical protein ACI841_000369 [Planctomycetota bacterium]|jgi:hypothetical protein